MIDSQSDQASQESLEGNRETVSINLMKLFISEKYFKRDNEMFDQVKKILSCICNDFIKEQYLKTGGSPSRMKKISGKLLPYGSYKLDTYGPTSDIDILLAAPKFVKKKYIFSKLYSRLEKCREIENLRKIESAYVPIMKFTMYGIKIDFTYSILNKDTIEEDIDLEDDTILDGMNPASIISLNGVRTNNMILNFVHDKYILFQSVVKLLKIWALRRYISGNVFGYLGGINIAIIAAHACQNTHETTPDLVLLECFLELSQWDWPHPLKINSIKKGHLKAWSSQANSDDVMPIITPAYPAINSMRNATKSSLHRMKREFNRAYKYTDKIVNGELAWSSLLAPPHFFSDYRIYIQVSCTAKDKYDIMIWRGIIEKDLRRLTKLLEATQQVSYAILFPHGFEEDDLSQQIFCVRYYFALSLDPLAHVNNSSSSYSDSESPTVSPSPTTTSILNQNLQLNQNMQLNQNLQSNQNIQSSQNLQSNQNIQSSQKSTYDLIIKQIESFSNSMLGHESRMPTMDLKIKILDRRHLPGNVVQRFGSTPVQRSPPKMKYVHKHTSEPF